MSSTPPEPVDPGAEPGVDPPPDPDVVPGEPGVHPDTAPTRLRPEMEPD